MVQILSITMVQICSIWCIYKRSRSPRHIFRSSGLFLYYPNTFSSLKRHFQDHFQIIQTLFRVSCYIFQIIRTLLTSYGNFPGHPDTFQIIGKLSSSSGYFAYYLDILYCKVSGNSSANNELDPKTFRLCKNFPVSTDGFFVTLLI